MEKRAHKQISILLPDSVVDELDSLARIDNSSRSEFISMAMKQYIRERRRLELKNNMKKGYLEMGDINLSIAEESLLSDESAYKIYEEFLSESEESDSKTR